MEHVDRDRQWWTLAVRGAFEVLFGLVFLFWPLVSLKSLVLVFGVWALIDGCAALVAAASGRASGLALFEGLFGLFIAAMVFFRPYTAATALYATIAVWAIVTGLIRLATAVQQRRVIANEFWLGLSGVTSVLFGVLMLALPAAGMLALAWLIGIYALMFGLQLIGFAVRLRRLRSQPAVIRVS